MPPGSDLCSYYGALEPNRRLCNFALETYRGAGVWQRSLPSGTSTWVPCIIENQIGKGKCSILYAILCIVNCLLLRIILVPNFRYLLLVIITEKSRYNIARLSVVRVNQAIFQADPELRIFSSSNIRNRRFLSVIVRQNRSKPLRFFVVLIGFGRHLNIGTVGFFCSKILQNGPFLSGSKHTNPRLLATFRSTAPPLTVLLYFFVINSNWDWPYQQKTTIINPYIKCRRYRKNANQHFPH